MMKTHVVNNPINETDNKQPHKLATPRKMFGEWLDDTICEDEIIWLFIVCCCSLTQSLA
jgi:hypothetical protein